MSHVICVVLTCVSKIESDGCDFCNHTVQQSLLGGTGVFQVFHSDPFIACHVYEWGFPTKALSQQHALGIVPPDSKCEFPPTRS